MKHLFCWAILGMLPIYLVGQDYLSYYEGINQAKRCVIQSDYEGAVAWYQKIFETFEFEFARDCMNALEVSLLGGSTHNTAYFMECALRRGVPFSYFSTLKKLEAYKNTDWWEELGQKAGKLHEAYQSGINSQLRMELNEMFAEDQDIRKRFYDPFHLLAKPLIGKKWRKLNEKQVQRILEITEIYGFPGEKVIGIDVPEYHPKIGNTQFSAGMPITILLHHYSHPNPSVDPLLLEEVKKGNVYNEHFASICDFEAEFGKDKYENMGYYGLRHLPNEGYKKEFTEKRKQIGLLTDGEIQQLNQVTGITKFWNRLK